MDYAAQNQAGNPTLGRSLMGGLGSASGGGAVLAAQPQRQQEIPAELERLTRVTSMLRETTALLAKRLTPVIHPEPPSAERAEQTGRPVLGTPIGSALQSVSAELQVTTDQLASLLARLELP